MSIGSRQTLVQIDNEHCIIKKDGTKVAKAQNLTATWGNTLNEENTIGGDIPDIWTGKFHGVITLDALYMTDLDLTVMCDPGNDGMVPEVTITGEFKDSLDTIDTWTFTARMNQPVMIVREQGFIRARLQGLLTGRPAKVQT